MRSSTKENSVVGMVGLSDSLRLPCGAVLLNRFAKAAMTEGLADAHNRATPRHEQLYRQWANNGFGMMLTGNIQVDRRHLERPGNIAIDNNGGLEALRALTEACTRDGAHFWAQLNHPGRQTPAAINARPLAPSAISLPMAEAACGEAQAMDLSDIADVVKRFARTAAICREVGFTGVQIHGAHGYLVSQFLSPLANQRADEWGGSLENRARFLLELVRATRAAVGADYPVALKLNSADFQRGGFSELESMQVVHWLNREKLDLIEISGGNYEQMRMVGLGAEAPPRRAAAASTLAREAYFLEYAKALRPLCSTPLMITGGMRSREAMDEALGARACDVIGVGRPMCTHPEGHARALLEGSLPRLSAPELGLAMARDALGPDIDETTFKRIESFGLLGWFCLQLVRLGNAREPDLQLSVFDSLIGFKEHEQVAAAAWVSPDTEEA